MILAEGFVLSCSILPECAILNCVNSAFSFPIVFLKVVNVCRLLVVSVRGSIGFDIWRVLVFSLSPLGVSDLSHRISLL